MKVINLKPSDSIVQALADAFYSTDEEPVTVCGNGIRVVFMKDDNQNIHKIIPKSPVKLEFKPRK